MSEAGHVAFIIPFASAVLIWWLGTILLLAVTRKLYVSKIIGLMFVSAILMQLGFFGLHYFSHHPVGSYAAYGSFFYNSYLGLARILFLVGWVVGQEVPCSPLSGLRGLNKHFKQFSIMRYTYSSASTRNISCNESKDTENYVWFYAFLILWGMLSYETEFIFGVRNLYINFCQKR